MPKSNHRILNGLLFVAAFMTAATSSCLAAGLQLGNVKGPALDRIGGYLKETGQGALAINTEMEVPPVPEYVDWNREGEWRDLFRNWGVNVDLSGLKLTLKLGFIRGGFDSYTQAYKVEPVVTVLDNTLDDSYTIWPYLRRGESLSYRQGHPGVDVGFGAQFDGGAVCLDWRDWKTDLLYRMTIPYDQLLSKWLSFAGQCSPHLGSTYCFVGQVLWRDNNYQYGWVTSERTPLYYTTGMPQDFVELFQEDKVHQRSYKPKAYSLPLRLTFVLSSTQRDRWVMRPMTSEERADAMTEGSNKRPDSAFQAFQTAPDTAIKGKE